MSFWREAWKEVVATGNRMCLFYAMTITPLPPDTFKFNINSKVYA
jgi:hypothetical protein